MTYDRHDRVQVTNLVALMDTEKALRVKFDGEDNEDAVWLPKSQIHKTDLQTKGDTGFVEIPYWLAEDRGLESGIEDDPSSEPSPAPPPDDGGVPGF